MKYYRMLFLCTLFSFLLPTITHAAIRINEVAWMGTAASQYSEWIELYNDSNQAVSLKDWKLYKTDNVLLYTLSKSISAGGYLLIERTTATAPDAVAGINDEAGVFGGSGLRNTGEDLTLEDNKGGSIEKLSFANGWPAGDAKTKDTMQWSSTGWITAPGTPDAVNTTNTATSTQSPQTTPVAVPATGEESNPTSSQSNTNSNSTTSVQTTNSNNSNAPNTGAVTTPQDNTGVAVPATPNENNEKSTDSSTNSQNLLNPSPKNIAGTASAAKTPTKKKASTTPTISKADISTNDTAADSLEDQTDQATDTGPKENNHIKVIIIGAVVLFILALFLLLQRFKAQEE